MQNSTKNLRQNITKSDNVRVSKEEQNEALQMDALKKYGCNKIFHEKV